MRSRRVTARSIPGSGIDKISGGVQISYCSAWLQFPGSIKWVNLRSQLDVADALGVTVTQLGKYEKGINRLKAGSIPILAVMFERTIEEFFEPDGSTAVPAILTGSASLPEIVIMLAEAAGRIEQAVTVLKCVLAAAAPARDPPP